MKELDQFIARAGLNPSKVRWLGNDGPTARHGSDLIIESLIADGNQYPRF